MKKIIKALLLALLVLVVPIMVACGQEKKEVLISVISSSYQDGTVLGGGPYKEEDNVTLLANATSGKTFVAWIKNNKIVSKENTYTFKAKLTDAGTYTAVFKGNSPTYLNPFALAFNGQNKKLDQNLTIKSISFNMAVGQSSQSFNITTHKDLDLNVYENAQSSSIYDFDSEYLLRLRSSYGEQTYTLSSSIVYTIGESQVTRATSKTTTLVSLEAKTDAFENTYYQATIPVSDTNLQGSLYVWFSPAGLEIVSGDISI